MNTRKPEVSPGAARVIGLHSSLNEELSKLLDHWSPRSVLVQLAVEILKRHGDRGTVGCLAEQILGQWPESVEARTHFGPAITERRTR